MESIVDNIPESQDRHETGDDWKLLLSPLTQSLAKRVSEAADELYVEPVMDVRLPITYFADSVLEDFPKDWGSRYFLLAEERDKPLILLGDPGVGKSSWIFRFIKHVESEERAILIYYDQHEEKGNPIGAHLSPQDKLRGKLISDLLGGIKRATQASKVSDPLITDADEDLVQQEPTRIPRTLIENMRRSCQTLDKDGYRIFLIIDNLDLYDSELQDAGIDFAFYISRFACVRPIVALRPSTYRHKSIALRYRRAFTVRASLDAILHNRLSYIWRNGGNSTIKELLNRLSRVRIKLAWGPVQDGSAAPLKELHTQVVKQLLKNQVLETLLQDAHNLNMREILAVISRLIDSYYFSTEILAGARPPKPEDLITAYMRGPYKHHRGRTDTYLMRDLDIWDIPGSSNGTMLVGVRVLQWISKWPEGAGGQSVAVILKEITQFGYESHLVLEAIRYLAHREFILDCFRLKEWLGESETLLASDDRFVIAPAGKLLLGKFLGVYAFRYLEAIADVIRRVRLDRSAWRPGKSFADMIWNVLGMVELIQFSAEAELRRLYRGAAGDMETLRSVLERFRAAFSDNDVIGNTFLHDLTAECCNRAEMLHGRRKHTGVDYYEEAATEAFLRTKIPELSERAKMLANFRLPPAKQRVEPAG